MKNLLPIDKIILNILTAKKNQWFYGETLREMVRYNTIGGRRPNPLEIRNSIQRLRALGNPIVAGDKGYMFTESIARLKLYCLTRRNEINKELAVLGSMELNRINKLNKEIK